MNALRLLRAGAGVARQVAPAGWSVMQDAPRQFVTSRRAFGGTAWHRAADGEIDLEKKQELPVGSPKVLKIADDICALNLLEVHDLSSIMKKRLGLEGMPMGGMMMGGGAQAAAAPASAAPAAAAAAAPAAKAEFDVKLESFDAANKIKIIKEVRAVTGLGLKEAKDLVEGSPAVIKKGLKKEEAEALKAKLTEAGGKVVLL